MRVLISVGTSSCNPTLLSRRGSPAIPADSSCSGGTSAMGPLTIVFGLGVLGVLFAFWLAQDVLKRDRGTPEMQQVASAIYEGAMAFMRRQYSTIIMLALVGCVVVGAVIAAVEGSVTLGLETAVSFLVGAGCSALAGFTGMYISIQ